MDSLLLHEIWKQYYASKKYVIAGNTCAALHVGRKAYDIEGGSVSSKKDVEPTIMLLKQRKWKSGIKTRRRNLFEIEFTIRIFCKHTSKSKSKRE